MAYRHNSDAGCHAVEMRICFPVSVMWQIFSMDMKTTEDYYFECCVEVIVDFIFHLRSICDSYFKCTILNFNDDGIQAALFCRKGKSVRRPFSLRFG